MPELKFRLREFPIETFIEQINAFRSVLPDGRLCQLRLMRAPVVSASGLDTSCRVPLSLSPMNPPILTVSHRSPRLRPGRHDPGRGSCCPHSENRGPADALPYRTVSAVNRSPSVYPLGMPHHPLSMTRLTTPHLLEPLVATAVVTVEFVTDRVFLVVVLVVILGRVELRGLHNLGYDRFLEGFVLFQ